MSQAVVSAERAFEQVKGMVGGFRSFVIVNSHVTLIEFPPPGPYEPQTQKVSCSAEGRPGATCR
jgi:hypothetical protein